MHWENMKTIFTYKLNFSGEDLCKLFDFCFFGNSYIHTYELVWDANRMYKTKQLLYFRPAMSNWNCLLSQKCHNLNQGPTLNDILMRATYWMTYFDLGKLNLVETNVQKASES